MSDNIDRSEVSSEWQLINTKTGEIRDVTLFDQTDKRERWEKVYAKSLANLLDIAGDERTKVIAYLIRKKDFENRIFGTMREMAKESGISTTTVNKTMQILQKNKYIHKVRNGVWRFSPHIMVAGKAHHGAAVYRNWNSEEGE